jgi:hypothetical protein
MRNANFSELKENLSEKIFSQLPNSGFPIEVFPEEIQEIIQKAHNELGYPVDYLSCSILFAASVAIGKSLKVEVKPGWSERAIVWLALIGNPGTTKSHPLNFCLSHFEIRDRVSYKIHRDEMDCWRKKSKKEKESIPVPLWNQRLVSDITLEALIQALDRNAKGLGLWEDELKGWVANFNRYNSGSEAETWLTLWSGKSRRINRKTENAGSFFIDDPFVSVAGTVQPSVIQSLFSHGRSQNGFSDRFLFSYPEGLIAENWQSVSNKTDLQECFNSIIERIDNLPATPDKYLVFTPNADKIRISWFNRNQKMLNEANKNGEKHGNFFAKLNSYYHRIALIIETLKYGCNESDLIYITEASAKASEKITEYFRKENLKVFQSMQSHNSPLEKLTDLEKKIFNALEDSFTTAEGVTVANEFSMPERTFKRFLTSHVFRKIKHGEYCKK